MKKLLFLIIGISLFSCEAIFVENISDKQIKVISPADSVQLSNTEVVFSWNEVTDADNYRLKVVTPDFLNAATIVLDTTINKTFYKTVLDIGAYQWSIVGLNSEYQTQETISSFTIN